MEKKEINCRYYELTPPLSVKEFGRIAMVNRHPDRDTVQVPRRF